MRIPIFHGRERSTKKIYSIFRGTLYLENNRFSNKGIFLPSQKKVKFMIFKKK